MDNNEKLYQLVADVFEANRGDINDDTSQDSLELWDSIHQMNLVFALEETFEVQLADEEVVEIHDVRTIKNILQGKGIIF